MSKAQGFAREVVRSFPIVVRILSVATIFILMFAGDANAQGPAPQILTSAVQCLTDKDFIAIPKNGKRSFGYFVDEVSYPNEKAMFVVAYRKPEGSSGLVFTIFLTQKDERQGFDIQNNASFKLSKVEPSGVSFGSPPLGGTWTQEHLAAAIKQIEKKPRYTLPLKDLSAPSEMDCTSYVDHLRNHD